MFSDPTLLADLEEALANYDEKTALFPRWVLESMAEDVRRSAASIARWQTGDPHG